ncbi:MAG: hypothetical protein AAFQ07_01780 [Chloroflexota bacterium]
MTDANEALNRLFEDALDIVDSLEDVFTSQEFLRRIIQNDGGNGKQQAYIDLLVACYDATNPFTKAHMAIGKRLREMQDELGIVSLEENREEETIFRTSTTSPVYRKQQAEERR